MARRSPESAPPPAPGDGATPAPPPAAPIIDDRAVFTMAQARELLGLKKHTLSREVREGRLRVSRRAGRNYLLGT